MPRKSGNLPEVTAGVGVGVGVGLGDGGGVTRAASPPPPLSQSDSTPDSTPEGKSVADETTSPRRVAKNRQTKPGTQCPEELTPEQRAQVRAWRDKKHPEFDDWILKHEWEKHAAHYGTRKTLRPDWVKSFYGWLLKSKDFSKSTGGNSGPARPTPPERKRSPDPPPWTPEQLAEAHAAGDARREKRRLSAVPQPEAAATVPASDEDEVAI
jgi:hypothetical protein